MRICWKLSSSAGLSVIPARAYDLEFHDDHVVVYTDSGPIEADVIVGAFGMDEGSSAMFNRLPPYRPSPSTQLNRHQVPSKAGRYCKLSVR